MGESRGRAPDVGRRWLVWAPAAAMLASIVAVLLARMWRLDVPLERDEGEYAYMGQLMLRGIAPYGIAANMKLPGTHAAYAVFLALFGQSIRGVHLGFTLLNAGSILLMYLLAKKLLGRVAGIAAAASYAVLSVSAGVDGLWAHATHFVVLFALAGTLASVEWAERPRAATLIASGLLFGLAFLMKQPGIFFSGFGGVFIVASRWDFWRGRWMALARTLALFGGAVLLPLAITCLLVWRAGVFDKFRFWVFEYARVYVALPSWRTGLRNFLSNATPIVDLSFGLWALAAAGLTVLWMRRETRRQAWLASGFLAFSWLAVCPGLYFRAHYFVLALPAAALLVGALAGLADVTAAGAMPLWLIAGALAGSLWVQRGYLVEMSPTEVMRGVYRVNPFPEAISIAGYIRAHSTSMDSVAVLGSEPEIYFYSGRRSATPYLYVNPLVEPHSLATGMQEEFIDDIVAAKPKFLVYASSPNVWGFLPDSPEARQGLMGWARSYYEQNYDLVGVVEIDQDRTVYKWGADAAGYRIESPDYLLVMQRKPGL